MDGATPAMIAGLLVLPVVPGMFGLDVVFAAVPFPALFMTSLVDQVQPAESAAPQGHRDSPPSGSPAATRVGAWPAQPIDIFRWSSPARRWPGTPLVRPPFA